MKLLPHGAKIGNATVIVDIISKRNPKIRPGLAMKPTHITDHDTGNPGRGANAEMHNRYIHNMSNYDPKDTSHVSWHITVDENFIYQHIPFDENAWHCGDGSGIKSGNRNSIGVEKTMNIDGDRAKVEENAIALHIYLLKNIINKTPANVVPHQHWSGKYCPAVILSRDGSFNPFRNRIKEAYSGGAAVVKPVTSTMHTIKRGDTLGAIAKKYNTTVDKLQKDNNIKNANFIYAGQTLKIGGTKKATQNENTKKPTKQTGGNSRIRTIQSTLNSRYDLNIPVDGYDGPITKSALIKALQFELNKQYNAGLVVDGIWVPKTRAAVVTVRKGARGNITWIIQARLYCLGYNPKGLDKIFGDGMYKEVRKYQGDKQIAVDGDVGKQTFTNLFA